jgi:hypothetical protein
MERVATKDDPQAEAEERHFTMEALANLLQKLLRCAR